MWYVVWLGDKPAGLASILCDNHCYPTSQIITNKLLMNRCYFKFTVFTSSINKLFKI